MDYAIRLDYMYFYVKCILTAIEDKGQITKKKKNPFSVN